jgi:predicted outer membrane protein
VALALVATAGAVVSSTAEAAPQPPARADVLRPSAGGPAAHDLAAADLAALHPGAAHLGAPHLAGQDPEPGPGPGGISVPETPPNPRGDGQLTAADKDFVVKVRLAGLWEVPAGRMAVEKGVDPRVRQIGQMISTQHVTLDSLDREAAVKLGIPLPEEPNADQQTWLGEMQRARGRDFDRIFVDRLRAAHGKVFNTIAAIRAGTRNEVVRKLAQESNQFVLTHLTLLESTTLVDYESLPPPPDPNNPVAKGIPGAQARAETGGVDLTLIWAVLGAALLVGTLTSARVLRPR